MKKLKLCFDIGSKQSRVDSVSILSRQSVLTFLLVFLTAFVGVGNAWAQATCTLTSAQIKAGTGNTSYGAASATDGCGNTWDAYAIKNQHSNATSSYHYWQIKKYTSNTAYYVQVPTMPGNITAITITVSSSSKARDGGENTATLYFSNSSSTSATGTGVVSGTGASSVTINCSSLNLTSGYITASAAVRIWDVEVAYTTGGTPEPTLSLEPTSKEFEATGNSAQTIGLTASNFASAVSSVTCAFFSEAECTTPIARPTWVNEPIVNNAKTQVSVNVVDNDGASRQTWMKITASDGSKNASAVFAISQKKYTEPTGTFNKFTGTTLTEGDYVITYNTNTLKNSVNSSRWENGTAITSGVSSLINPDESIIWHISASGNYWLLYNAAVEKYAAGTNSKNQGSMVDMPQGGASDMMKWTPTVSNSTWQFENYGRSQANSDSGNKWLRNNGNSGWATYASSTGGALTLYKKATAPKAVTIDSNIANGSVEVTGADDLAAVPEGTELTLTNTPDAGYKFKAYDVYKTGESTTKVTVTNNTFNMPDYAVTVSATFEEAKVLTGIEITTQATQKTFWVGEIFNYEGLVVTAHYQGAADEVVTPTVTGGNTSVAGENISVTVSYTEGTTHTANYTITVKALPTENNPGSVADMIDIWDKLGDQNDMYVRGTIYKINNTTSLYSDKYITYWITDSYDAGANPNHTNEFELYNGLDFGGAYFKAVDDLELGQEVVVKGNLTRFGNSAPYTYEFGANNIIISRPKVLRSIALSGDYPTEFEQGNEFSSEGLVVTASYNYGDPAQVTPTSITGYDMSATGNQTVTVSYTEAGVTKTKTYSISVAVPDLCQNKITITKGDEANGTFELSASGAQCLDELQDNVIDVVLTANPAENYHLESVTSIGAGEATVGQVGAISENSCTISGINANTTITAVFAENDKVTVKFAKGTESATGSADDIMDKYAGQNVTLPANPFTYTGEPMKVFGGWKHSLTDVIYQPCTYQITAADAAEDYITFTAVWEDLSPWATEYNSNVTLTSEDGTNADAAIVRFTAEGQQYNAIKVGTSKSKSGQVKVTIPAGTTKLHYHAYGWNGETTTLSISAPEGVTVTPTSQVLISNSGIANSTPFTFAENSHPEFDAYYCLTLTGVNEEKTLTFANNTRFVLFGVNAVYPEITLNPATSYDFGPVAAGQTKDKVFEITANDNVVGPISASITNDNDDKFSVGEIDNNTVTVTFAPGEATTSTFSAKLQISATNVTAMVDLSGTATSLPAAELSFPEESYDANLGTDFAEPILTTDPENLTVIYSSSETDVATVDVNNGAVTLLAEGSTIIKAEFSGNENYAANSAQYTLTVVDPNKDVLTATGIGASSYGSGWSGKTFTSGVEYAGLSTTGTGEAQGGAIQMKAKDNSGIVTTSTKGYLKYIAGTRQDGSNNLAIYAKNTAYTSAADLYEESTRGTLIGYVTNGEIVFETGEAYSNNYKYIGIKANGGAVYYSDITIKWEPVVFPKYTVTYQAGTGASGEDVLVEDIEEGTTIQLSGKPEEFSYSDHAFAGWKLNGEGETLAAGSDYEVNGDVTFVAQWTTAYTITYEAGEAGEAQVQEEVAAGEYHLAAKPEAFTYEGHIFMGWKLETAPEEEVREVNSVYTVTCSAVFVAQWVEANEITFVAGTDVSTTTTLMKTGISITASTFNNNSYYQCYAKGSMTITSVVGDIIKIELTSTGSGADDYSASKFSTESGSYSSNENIGIWAGSAESVTLAASAQVRMTQIVVTYTPNGNVPKQAADLNYETKNYEVTVGNPFSAPTLTNPHDLPVTYAGNKDAVATVDATSGALTLTGEAGSVTVTASFEGNDAYYAGSASYTLVVKEVSDNVNGSWRRVTNAANLEDGERIIIAEYSSSTSFTTMGKDKGNNRYAVASTLSSDVLTPGEGTCVLTLEAIGANTYALKTTGGKYLYAASSSSNYLKEKNDLDENGNSEWTISITNGEATILAQGTNSRKLIRYNSSSDGLFSCYANEGTPSQNAIAIYSKTVKPAANADMTAVDAYADIVIEGGTFTANDATKPLGQVTIKNGAEMEVNATTTTESLVVEDGGKVTLNENVEADVFQIAASKTTNEGNSSGQVIIDVNNAKNLRVTGEAYFDYTLDPSGTASYGYYAFCVPFPVNSSTGIYTTSNVKLYDGIDYVLYSYHGDIRATGNYGWKRFNGTLTPGVFYLISLYADENNVCAHNTIRFKMEAQPGGYNCNRVDATVGFNKFETSTGVDASNSGWNGVGNPTVQYVKAQSSSYYHSDMYVYNHSTNAFVIKSANTFTFTVGSPFFIQAGATASMSFDDGSDATENILAPARVNGQTIERICVSFGNETYKDQLFVAASEDALNSYQITKDLAKMSMGTAKVAQISSSNYGVQLAVEYAPLVDNQATYQLNLFAPAAGTYSISAQQVEGATLYVTYNGAIVWNLSLGDYELDLTRGTTTGYGLLLVVQPNQMPTGVENGELLNGENGVQKILLNGNLYILRDGHLYDAVGKQAR